MTFVGLGRFWHDIKNRDSRFSFRQWGKTFGDVMALRNMTGGAEGCSYIENQPSLHRKIGHQLLMYGFLGTFLATVSAMVYQYILDLMPPYGISSVPVILGSVGGVSAIVGCVLLVTIKPKADASLSTPTMYRADQRLIVGLLIIMVTGFFVTSLRFTVAFPVAFIVHIACVATGFLVFPRSKFVHLFFRTVAIYQDNLEVAERHRQIVEQVK